MMDSSSTNEIVDRFGGVAKRFCDLVESAEQHGRSAFLLRMYQLLPELIHAALQLPDMPPGEESEEVESARVPKIEWSRIYDALGQVVGDWGIYWQVFDSTEEDEPVAGSLADDFADIYRDLDEGIKLSIQHPPSPRNVIWQWRFSFYTHWGKHAIDALQVIHGHAFDINAFNFQNHRRV